MDEAGRDCGLGADDARRRVTSESLEAASAEPWPHAELVVVGLVVMEEVKIWASSWNFTVVQGSITSLLLSGRRMR